MRKPEDILKDFDEGYPKFKWFIKKYFHKDVITDIERARKENTVDWLLYLLNSVWYYLPDSQFNIEKNPSGWTEFLKVIEE